MNDAAVRELARRAGVAVAWTDYAGKRHQVPLDAVRRIVAALGLPCDTAEELAQSRQDLAADQLPSLLTTEIGKVVTIPLPSKETGSRARLVGENGEVAELSSRRTARGLRVPGLDTPGYCTLEVGERRIKLAVAPQRCITVADIAPHQRLWGLAAQVYGLRRRGDCGIGDMAGVSALDKAAVALGADALALSPMHALFTADPRHCSPYSPSSRLFYNPLHADASAVFGEARLAKAHAAIGEHELVRELEGRSEIDWAQTSRLKLAVFRRLFEDFSTNEPAGSPLAADFAKFSAAGGEDLKHHALFEALHAARLRGDPAAWSWQDWASEWRDVHSAAVKNFAEKNAHEVRFHAFLQWIADRSLAAAQEGAKQAGMRIGLIADLAIGTDNSGSHCWTNRDDMLTGLQIGAPPDLFNTTGQNWGLTNFSPRALVRGGFAPFLATIRACMRHAGGVRIDHAMGMMRLWVIPHGAKADEGAYLAYPLDDILRLTVLESHRHRAIVIGEDLGTVPAGFRERLAETGIYGMRVLWFEREEDGFALPSAWPAEAAAMTSTHDLPTVAGWWSGSDIELRARHGFVDDVAAAGNERIRDRQALWGALRAAKVDDGGMPAPEETSRVADAAVKFIAQTPSRLALLPLEDALALEEQPNLPGTVDEHPNWRRRYQGDAADLLTVPQVRHRLKPLGDRGEE